MCEEIAQGQENNHSKELEEEYHVQSHRSRNSNCSLRDILKHLMGYLMSIQKSLDSVAGNQSDTID